MPPYIRGDSTSLTATDHDLIKKYLLGADLGPDNLRRVERLYFSDQGVMEQVELAEDELIEQYLRDELSPQDTRRFDEHFLASHRNQERVRFFQNLLRLAEEQNRKNVARLALMSKNSRLALVAAGLAIFMIPTVWLMIEARQLVNEVATLTMSSSKLRAELDGQKALTQRLADQLRNEQELRQKSETALSSGPAVHAGGNGSGPAVLSFLLMPTPSETRGQVNPEPPRRAIPRSVNAVQLDLVLPRGAAAIAYAVSIDRPDGTQVWSGGPVASISVNRFAVVQALVPSAAIGNDDYIVNLQSIASNHQLETIETYSFRTLVIR